MADLPPDAKGDTGNDTGVTRDRESPPGIPSWLKVLGVIAIALVVLFVILHLTGNGFGPGSHTMP